MHTFTSPRPWLLVALFVMGVLFTGGQAQEPVQSQTRQTRADQSDGVRRQVERRPLRLRMTAERRARIARARAQGLGYVPGEVVVRFRDGVETGPALARVMSAVPDSSASGRMRWAGRRAVISSDMVDDPMALAAIVGADPDVAYAEPNYLATFGPVDAASAAPLSGGARLNAIPDDPEYATRQWNFDLLDMPRAWDISPGGDASLIVAVLDSGVTTEALMVDLPIWTGSGFTTPAVPVAVNPDLSPSRFVGAIDLVFFADEGPVVDMDGHGTHVASTIAQDTNNGFGLAGIAYNVRLMPVKVCYGYWEEMYFRADEGTPGFADPDDGGCPFDAIAQGIEYAADSGARVINMSFGGTGQSTAMREAMSYALGKGVFMTMSGGNRAQTGNQIGYPAGYAPQFGGAMSAGAISRSQIKAPYSSTGPYIEIAAPGGSTSDGGAAGQIWQSTIRQADVSTARFLTGVPLVTVPRFDRYESTGFSGTSMAAPHVAGLAALLMSRGITQPSQIEQIIRITARDLGPAGQDDSFGFGLIQPRAALFGLGIR